MSIRKIFKKKDIIKNKKKDIYSNQRKSLITVIVFEI